MSAIDTTCYPVASERGNGTEKINCFIPPPYDGSAMANEIASEVVNEILENAMDIVMKKEKEPAPSKVEKISTVVVGDILENILSKAMSHEQPTPYPKDETVLLDDEIKRIIKEMKYPPEQKNIICTKGVGDQLENKSETILPDAAADQQPKRNTLERKNRLTNLVKNSKQILSKLLTTESERELNKNEEKDETLIKVIDFEQSTSTQDEVKPEGDGPLNTPNDSTMQVVDLKAAGEDRDINQEMDMEDVKRCLQKEASRELEKEVTKEVSKEACSSKKKFNLGAKFLKYLKRGSKKEPHKEASPSPEMQ